MIQKITAETSAKVAKIQSEEILAQKEGHKSIQEIESKYKRRLLSSELIRPNRF